MYSGLKDCHLSLHSSQPSTNGSTGRPTVVQLPKAALPPAGPAYSVAAGGHHNNTPAPASLSPPSQSLSNSMVNHTGGILSPSETTSMPTVPSGMPLQNGPVSLLSPLSKQQHQMSGLLPMTSPLSNQKSPSDQQLPNSTVSLSQSSTNSSFLDEAVFTGLYIQYVIQLIHYYNNVTQLINIFIVQKNSEGGDLVILSSKHLGLKFM